MKGRFVAGAGTQGKFGRKRFPSEGSTGAGGGTALSPCCQIVSVGLAQVLPNKEVSSHSPKKIPMPGFMGAAPRFGNAGCFNCRETGRSRGWRFLFQNE